MLETILEYAAERLAASGEVDEIRARHAEHFRDLAEEAEPHLMGERQFQWMERLEAEHDNVRAALDHAEMGGDVETALRTACAIWRFWQFRGHLGEGRSRLERLLALPGAKVRGPVRARALSALGGIAYWQNDYEAVRRPYEEAVEIAREVGDRRLLSGALFDLSFVPFVTAMDFDGSERLINEAMAVAPEDDLVLQAQIWTHLGYMQAFRGDLAAASAPVERAIGIHRQLGDRVLTSQNLFGLAGLRMVMGDAGAARSLLAEGVGLLAEMESPLTLAMALVSRGFLAGLEGDHARTARLLGAWGRMKEEGAASPPPMALAPFGDPEAVARAALGDDAFEQARDDGYAMTNDQAWTYVFEEDHPKP
jgi:non-specific serine/threonine protein kinase